MQKRTEVVVVGGGLAGLCAGRALHTAGVDVLLLEARDRLGGRILSADEDGHPSDDGFDLGASWFWPAMQPSMASLAAELGLATFAQSFDGDVVFERMSRETPQHCRPLANEPQSMRLVGGTGALVRTLATGLPGANVRLGNRVTAMSLGAEGVTLDVHRVDGSTDVVTAKHVVAAVPPRLLGTAVSFSPAIDEDTVRRWRSTGTWMAPHAKFFAFYDAPFWRDAGLSGTAQSLVGPMAEIHDATTASGSAALLGFVSAGADHRAALGDEALARACVEQLVRLFGVEARRVRKTIIKDWAADPWTATADDRSAGTHPVATAGPWVKDPWRERLHLAASEVSPLEPGFMAGAVEAAGLAAANVLGRIRAASQ